MQSCHCGNRARSPAPLSQTHQNSSTRRPLKKWLLHILQYSIITVILKLKLTLILTLTDPRAHKHWDGSACTAPSPLIDNIWAMNDVCLEVRGEIIRTVLFCIVYWCKAHLDEQFLQFSGLGFVTLGPCHCAYCVWARRGGPDGIEA